MKNPIVLNTKSLAVYVAVWTIIIIVHTVILYHNFHFPLKTAVTDSFVFNVFFAIIGINIWYLVRYSEYQNKAKNFFKIATNFILGAFLIVGIWYTLSAAVTTSIVNNDKYVQFLSAIRVWRLLLASFMFAIISLMYYVILYKQNWNEKLEQEKQLQQSIRKIELDALKMQINPHFLFNALNSISFLTITNPNLAQEMIIKMSDFLRYSLKYGNTHYTTLKDELENCYRYLEIEKLRFQEKLNFKFLCNDIEATKLKVPVLLLQPLLENAIKHGVYNSSVPIEILLECNLTNNFLHIQVTNNYDAEASVIKGEGVGLQNVADRLRFMYNQNHLLQVNNSNSRFTVNLKIPINM